MPHEDYAVFAAIATIGGVTALALVLGVADGLLTTALTLLAGLGGFRLIQGMVNGQGRTGP